jgi:[citrate (pro-3S)-lyase] ligase
MLNYVSTDKFFELKDKNKDKPFVLYGASYEGRSLADVLKSLGHVVNFYCDRDINIIGKRFAGIPVIAPEKLSAKDDFYFILVSATAFHYESIKSKLESLNLNGVVCFPSSIKLKKGSGKFDAVVIDSSNWLKSNPALLKSCFGKNKHYLSDPEGFVDTVFCMPRTRIVGDMVVQSDYKSKYVNVISGRRLTAKNPENYENKIHVFGDSKMFGTGVDDESTACSILQKHLLSAKMFKKYLVSNCSVLGCSIMNMLNILVNTEINNGDIVIFTSGRTDSVEAPKDGTFNSEIESYMFYDFLKDANLFCQSRNATFLYFQLPTVFSVKKPSPGEKHIRKKLFLPNLFRFERHARDFENFKTIKKLSLANGINYIDLTESVQRPHNFGDIFIDPVHFGSNGMELVARNILKTITDYFNIFNKELFNKSLAYKEYFTKTEKQIILCQSIVEDVEFENFIEKLRSHSNSASENNGAIVMNCNPFTFGHQFLIEEVSKQVDRLYILVLQENLSDFSFDDRINMVVSGVKHLKNVMVLPSGKFIISSRTFPEYFKKDALQNENIDASLDIGLFGTRIAPALNIKTRFVGDEPFCKVTNAYNMQMKEILPKYGVEFKIVQRKKVGDTAVSASRVRKLMKEGNIEELMKLVPATTVDYLKKIKKI